MKQDIAFTLNGETIRVSVDSTRRLLWVLRSEFKLTGTKYGCGKGLCGSCTVVVDKKAVRSCLVTVASVSNKDVLTIEGLALGEKLHPVQKAFAEKGALQCGFCTPGMIMNAYSLLLKDPEPSRGEIIGGMEGNLCRCGAYQRILEAVQAASKELKGA